MRHPILFPINTTDKQRFLAKLAPPDNKGCRMFIGGQCESYGRYWLQDETRQAQYVAFAISQRRVPLKDVLWHCGNKLCCEPSHLFEGQGNVTTKRNFKERFESKVQKLPADHPEHRNCWEWIGSRCAQGYAIMHFRGRQRKGSHLALEFYKGQPRPSGLQAAHDCDYPPCVNPAHLRWDTSKGNARDRVARKRTATGLKNGAYTKPESRRKGRLNGRAKFTVRQVYVIRRTCDAYPNKRGVVAALARIYRVHETTVIEVRDRTHWKHLPENAYPHVKALPIHKLNLGRAKQADSPNAKLSERMVREIRFIYGLCGDVHGIVTTIVRLYDRKIGRTHVLRVLKRETWADVTDSFHKVKYVRNWFAKDEKGRPVYTVAAMRGRTEFGSAKIRLA